MVIMQMDIKDAWKSIEQYLTTTRLDEKRAIPDSQTVEASVKILSEHGLSDVIEEWYLEVFQQDLQSAITPLFWSHFTSPISSAEVVSHLGTAFEELYTKLASYNVCLQRLKSIQSQLKIPDQKSNYCLEDKVQLLLKAIVFPAATKNFQDAVLEFYSMAFKAFDATTSDQADESGEEAELMCCTGCDEERESCVCQKTIQAFHTLNNHLRELGLLERLSGEAVSCIIHQRIHHHVQHTCKGNFEQAYLIPLEQWLQSKVVGWLDLLYGAEYQQSYSPHILNKAASSADISAHKERLYHFMYNIYANTRIEELFNIIIEFPESEPALLDLKVCLDKTELRSRLVSSLKTALETRLLHPGVNTSDILTAYMSAIKALRVLDPTGVLLELVCEPVRKYLRCRDDTVRCIVSAVTEDSSNELTDELLKGQPLVLDESFHDDEDMEKWESWQPDPVDADPGRISQSRRSSDIISMLVNIYGSNELFVKEYSNLLADRILAHFNYDTEKEIRYLELLKLRFGESQLHNCEVMLKDVADSRRINSHIVEKQAKEEAAAKKAAAAVSDDKKENVPQKAKIPSDAADNLQEEAAPVDSVAVASSAPSTAGQSQDMASLLADDSSKPVANSTPTPLSTPQDEKEGPSGVSLNTKEGEDEGISVNAMILSAQFWPQFREEKLELPQVFQDCLNKYTKSFEALKGNRTLNWKTHIGLVNIEIELKDRKLELNVNPVQATIIWHFQNKARWSVEELSSVMHMPTAAIRRKIIFWQGQGILKEESPDVFLLVEEQKGRSQEVVIMEEDETESAMASASDQREEELQVVWSYIVGMLTNLDSLPLDRIHSMLRMFAMQGTRSDCSLGELKAFLDRKVKEQKLMYSGGVYRLYKPGT